MIIMILLRNCEMCFHMFIYKYVYHIYAYVVLLAIADSNYADIIFQAILSYNIAKYYWYGILMIYKVADRILYY